MVRNDNTEAGSKKKKKKVEAGVLSPSLSRIGTAAQIQPAQVKLITARGGEPTAGPGVWKVVGNSGPGQME